MGNRNKKLGKKSIDVTETSQQQQKAVKLSCPNIHCDEKQKTLDKLSVLQNILQNFKYSSKLKLVPDNDD